MVTVLAFACLSDKSLQAGMPTPYLVLTELGKRRLEEISFFLCGFLLVTAICRWLWNGLSKDFPTLPRISYRGALGMLVLWGLAMTVVLSLVSGARELMTPAAWEPNGITQRLAKSIRIPPTDEFAERRQRFESVRIALWDYAAKHEMHFPSDLAQLPPELIVADTTTGLRYFLQPDLKMSPPRMLLLSEPDLYPQRLHLMTDGAIVIDDRPDMRKP